MVHEIVVGNIGTVQQTSSEALALETYREYVRQSKEGTGRATREPVTWFEDGEIRREHVPPAQEPDPLGTYYKVWVEIERVVEDLDEYTKVDLGFAATANFKHEKDAVKFAHALHACGEDGLKRLMPAEVFYEH